MDSANVYDLDNSPRVRRIVQAVLDIRNGDVSGARVLDLGCAHGLYSLEFARLGATSLGLEGRMAWIDQATSLRDVLGLDTAQFVQGDVRRVTLETHGQFDIILCLGLLYHLDAEEAAALLSNLYDMTKDFVVIDTQISLNPAERREINCKEYFGTVFPEHAIGTSPEDMEAVLGASLDSNFSFWFTPPSLFNLLGDVGFSSVYEIKWPADYMYLNGDFRVHEDYITLIAVKGSSISDFISARPNEGAPRRCPEDISDHILQRPWTKNKKIGEVRNDNRILKKGSNLSLIDRVTEAFLVLRGN